LTLSKKRARFCHARTTKLCAQNITTILANHLRLKKSFSSRIFIWKTRPIFEFIKKEGEILPCANNKIMRAKYCYNFNTSFVTKKIKFLFEKLAPFLSLSKKRARFYHARSSKLYAWNIATILASHLRLKNHIQIEFLFEKLAPFLSLSKKRARFCHARTTKLCAIKWKTSWKYTYKTVKHKTVIESNRYYFHRTKKIPK